MAPSRVLIVGAGVAGVAAATRLLENGIKDFIILEAGKRIGGRVHSTKFGDGTVDLGAQWVHGEKDNVVSAMAQPLGLLGLTLTEVTDGNFVSSSGDLHSTKTTIKFLGLLMKILSESEEPLKMFKGSLGKYLTDEYHKELAANKVDSRVELALATTFLDWFAKFENSIDGSDSWFYTSGPGHTHYRDCEGNILQAWKSGGFQNILDLLTKKLPDPSKALPVEPRVHFAKEVANIEWDTDDGLVSTHCADGSTYHSEHVVVTASLGVLKERSRTLFTPELPAKKLAAIYGLSIGTVDKIYLHFPRQWWADNALGFSFLWTKEDETKFNESHPTESGRHWLTDVFGFYEVDHNPNVLCGWVVGPSARVMEALDDDAVLDGCMALLERFLGRSHGPIPRADRLLRTTWSADPHFRGSYSFRSMDSDAVGAFAGHLAEPLADGRGKQTLLFAGEATHDHFFSTVHGAVESGWREADRLLKILSEDPALVLAKSLSLGSLSPPCRCRVVIVGAGIAGLAAARTLLAASVHDVLILEAQGRAGGRIMSTPLAGGWVEAGAQWIHGSDNPVWRLAERHHLLATRTSAEGEGPYCRDDGSVIDPSTVAEVNAVVTRFLEECEQYAEQPDHSPAPPSIGEHLEERFTAYLDGCRGDTEHVRQMKEELFDWHVRFQLIDNSTDRLDKLSAKAWGNYSFCGGTDYVNFERGYSSIVDVLTADLPAGVLHCNSPVTLINWQTNASVEHEAPVRVCFGQGSTVMADHCIVTSSLGFLKEHLQMFRPPLPSEHTQAIQEMGFSTINKIFLDFGTPWWPSTMKGVQLVWTRRGILPASSPMAWTRDLTGFDVLPEFPAVLLGWVGGRGAELVEDVTDTDVAAHCTQLLRRFMSNPALPAPRAVLRTRWRTEPFVRGAYSNTSTACDASRRGPVDLAHPVTVQVAGDDKQWPAVLLAGEAAHSRHFSTTHGAFESGEQQAGVVVDFIRRRQTPSAETESYPLKTS